MNNKKLKGAHRKAGYRTIAKTDKQGNVTRIRVRTPEYLSLKAFARSVASPHNDLGEAAHQWLNRKGITTKEEK